MLFKELIGHERLKQHLIKSVNEDQISHAQLFLGPEGNGGLALALAFAQYISCLDRQVDDACGRCRSCVKAQKLIHPDIHYSYPTIGSKVKSINFLAEWRAALLENSYLNTFEWLQFIKAENKQGNITADECDDIIRKLSFKAFEGKYKVLIMWRPEYLKKEGNRLLKLIEEPPENTVFILVAENPNLILNTILSRTQILKVPRYPDQVLKSALKERHQLEDRAASTVAALAEGNYYRALKLIQTDQVNNVQLLANWLGSILYKKVVDNVRINEELATLGREKQKNFLQYALYFLRQCLMLQVVNNYQHALNTAELPVAQQIMSVFQVHHYEKLLVQWNEAIYHIERNANPKLLFLHLSITMQDMIRASA